MNAQIIAIANQKGGFGKITTCAAAQRYLCIENGYSIVENPKPHGKSYGKCWATRQNPPTGSCCAYASTTLYLKSLRIGMGC